MTGRHARQATEAGVADPPGVGTRVADTVDADTLEAEALTVRYGDREVLHGVSVRVRPGELIAVTGPSGAGKSTLLSALGGLLDPQGGTVAYGGVPLRGRDHAVSRAVVLIPQGNALVRVMTALENVAVPLIGDRRRRPTARADAMAVLAAVGLEDAAEQLVEELSGGQQQRVAVARGLAQQGAVVLADEPTSELDAANRGVVMALLRAEADRGAGVLVATHDPEAAAVCDAELRLDEGVATWARDDRRPAT